MTKLAKRFHMKVFRVSFEKSGKTTLDVQAEHIGLAIGKALKRLQKKLYTYQIEDCISAELVATPIEDDKEE